MWLYVPRSTSSPSAPVSAASSLPSTSLCPDARLVCAVERDAFAASVVVARMAEKALASAPVWDDVATFDGRPWRGVVDLVTAGFPCQPWSQAGSGLGVTDPRWLWPAIADIIADVDPGFVFVENVPRLATGGGLALVLDSLARLGFDAEWSTLAAADLGAPHLRRRLFCLAYRHGRRLRVIGPQRPEHAPRRVADRGVEGVADSGHRRLARPRDQHAGQPDPGGLGPPVADPGRVGSERGRVGRGVEGPQGRTRRPAREQSGDAAGNGRATVADPDGVGLDGRAPVPGRRPDRRATAARAGETVGDAERGPGRAGLRPGGPPEIGSGRLGNPGDPLGDADVEGRERPRHRPPHASGLLPVWPPGPDDADGWAVVAGAGGPVPSVRRVADGLAYRLDRLHAIGNGVVPVVAAYALVALARRAGVDG